MGKFMILTKSGKTPPKYEHLAVDSAIAEAKRLHELTKEDVKILEIVGEIKFVEVPVTRTETRIIIDTRLNDSDELPF